MFLVQCSIVIYLKIPVCPKEYLPGCGYTQSP